MGLKLRKRNRYKQHTPIDYILVDKRHPYVSDPGDSENPGSLSDRTMVMHPVFVTAKNLSGRDVNPFNLSDEEFVRGGEPQTVQNLHSRRWVQDHPEEYERQRLFNIQQNEGLITVSPEFDLLTLGMGIKDLWKGYNAYRLFKKAPMTYTGVRNANMANFNDFTGNIFTSDNLDLANQYASMNRKFGKIFKIYDTENGKNIAVIPKADPVNGKEVAYSWADLPYRIDKDGKILKITGGEGVQPYKNLKNKQGLFTGGVHNTDELIEQAKNAGYRGIEFQELFEGDVLDKNLNGTSPIIREIIYDGSASGLVRTPLSESLWLTALKNSGTNFGGITSFGTGLTRYGFNNND